MIIFVSRMQSFSLITGGFLKDLDHISRHGNAPSVRYFSRDFIRISYRIYIPPVNTDISVLYVHQQNSINMSEKYEHAIKHYKVLHAELTLIWFIEGLLYFNLQKGHHSPSQ